MLCMPSLASELAALRPRNEAEIPGQKCKVCTVNDEEPTGEPSASWPPPAAGNEPSATSEFDAVPASASRPRRRMRAGAAGSALASRTTGWIVAAALAGSLVTLLLTGQLHSSQVSYVRPAAAQRPARTSHQAPATPRRLAAPAQKQASASVRQLPIVVRPGRVAYRSAQPPMELPRTCRLRLAVPARAGRPVAVPARVKVLVPRACRPAVPAPVIAGLPAHGRLHVLPRRAYRVAVPAPLPAAAPRIVIGRVRAPRLACPYAGPPSGRATVIRLPGARRLVIVRGRPASGRRASLVPVPRRGRFLPAPPLGGRRWQRVLTIKGHRVMIGVIAPGRSWTVRPACLAPRRTRRP
jgi:hypothetical protein